MGILDLIFPKICVSCGQKGSYFCQNCQQKIRRAFQIIPQNSEIEGLFCVFAYEGVIKNAIHKLKYQLITDLEKEFWEIIKQELIKKDFSRTKLELFLKKQKPMVIPIPLYWYKQNKRGFNQACFFGREIAKHYNLTFSDKILIRRKNVISQTQLNKKEREKNVKNIFSISSQIKQKEMPKNILLVDDVWTTGSTMNEAAKTLKEKGVKKIWGLTVAR